MLNSKNISRQIKKISVEVLVFLLKTAIIGKRVAVAIYRGTLAKPGRWFLRLVFYKVAVKLYQRYFTLMRRLGWKGTSGNFFNLLSDQKSVHIVVALVTVSLVFTNLISDTKAQDLADPNNQTILSGLIEGEFGTAEENQLIEETFDQEQVISPTQQKYLDNLSSVTSQPVADLDALAQEDAPLDAVEPDDSAKQDLVLGGEAKQERQEIIDYTVQQGDTISTIARKFGIGVNTILWQNNLNAYSVIRPGDTLSILPTSGVVHPVASGETLKAIAARYDVAEDKIAEYNRLANASRLIIGQKLIIPGGRKDSFTEQKAKSYSGLAIIKDLVTPKKSNPSAPRDQADQSDSKNIPKNAKPTAGNKMAWPTAGYRITQYFSWRHYAIDVANKVGTPLYAADAGVIETAGWGKGYGNQIVVNHGGGKKTRYAHLSKFYVKVGEQVDKGQTIGAMGNTGWSTGPHLHFEVIINGVKYNPLNYVR